MKKLLLITLCVLTYATTFAQIITTIAGGFGDGVSALNTPLNFPYATAVDGSGNIYIADNLNNRIRKVTASTGIISTVAGNGIAAFGGDGSAATLANINIPQAITVDGSGNIYFADFSNQRIRKITASTGIITTVAGNGIAAFGGDGSAATLANLNNPQGVALDVSGNIYIVDRNNHRIRKVTASTGIISTVAGNGIAAFGGDGSAATLANINFPRGVAVDGTGNIYITDQGNNRIRKVTASTGIITTVAGNGILGYGGDDSAATSAKLFNPVGVAVDGAGNIYIADVSNHRIRKVTALTGIISTVAGNGTGAYGGDDSAATLAKLFSPSGVTLDGSGNIYIADASNFRIRKITVSTGIISSVAGNGTASYRGDGSAAIMANLYNPTGVAVDGSGNIYIADFYNQRVRKITASTGVISTVAGNGTQAYGGDNSLATLANLTRPSGVAVDGLGNIYIADSKNHRIRKVTATTGIISTVAGSETGGFGGYGGDDSAATSAKLKDPQGVAVDGSGNIYIADASNHRIRKVTASTGIITTVAGSGTLGFAGDGNAANLARLNNPIGVTVDGNGNIYIADANNHRIRKVTASTGVISTIAGDGTLGFGGDGNAAILANLNTPSGVTVDGSGNIYIADANNQRIRKVTASTGFISTVAGNGTQSNLGDGSAATLANLYYPTSIALDVLGNIYIADKNNNRIRKVTNLIGNNIISSSQTICAGSAPANIFGSTPTGANGSYTYTWLRSTTSATTGFTAIPSSNTINYSPGVLTQNTWFKRYVVSSPITDTSAAVAIIINTPIVNNSFTITSQTICSGSIPAPITATTPTGGNGTTYKYKWLKSLTGETTGFANAGGNDSLQNFIPNALTQTTWFKRKVISGVCNADTTTELLVTVNPKPAITNASTASICSGTSTNIILESSISSTFAWTLGTNTGSITGASASNGSSINQILTNPSNTDAGSVVYNVTPTSTLGSCVGNPTAITVTINPNPTTSNISGKANTAKLDTASYSVSGLSGSVFNWLVSGATIQSGAGSNKIQVKWTTTGIDTIKVTETSNQGCVGVQKSLSVNVSPAIGMNELKVNNQIIIYPNPFSETLHITLLNNLKLEKAIIYDLVGNEIIISNKNEIDASSLKSGIYLIMIVDNIGNSYSEKLMKN